MDSFRKDGFTSLSSDHLDGVKYDSSERKMTVRFKNGYTYDVHGVSPEDHQEFLNAPSHGQHWHSIIKDQFHIERVK